MLWYKKDATFNVPKAKIVISFKSPLAYVTPLSSVLTRLFTDLLEDSLNAYSYYAQVAGLNYYIDNNTEGFEVCIFYFNVK